MFQTVDSFWAPKLGFSNLTYLGFSQRIIVAIGTLVIVGPSTVIVPRLTKKIASGLKLDFLGDIILLLKLVIYFSSFVAVVGSVLSKEIIYFLFQRGNFCAKDSETMAMILPNMLFGMVLMLCVVILFRAVFASGVVFQLVIIGIFSLILYFALSGIGAHTNGIYGISLAYLFSWFIIFALTVAYVFYKNYSLLVNWNIFTFIFKQVFLIASTSIFAINIRLYLITYLEFSMVYKLILVVVITFILSFYMYYILTKHLLKISEPLILIKRYKS
jgi:putative peptidoglycan lipid II flippase